VSTFPAKSHAAKPLALAAAAWLGFSSAFARTPALDAGAAPHLDFSTAQQETIFQSINKIAKNNAAPLGFRAAVGAVMPSSIELVAVPETIVQLVPQTRGLEAAQVEGQVVLVEPKAKQVVAIIVPEKP
jgi:Protein of unknown function (DUF1236)